MKRAAEPSPSANPHVPPASKVAGATKWAGEYTYVRLAEGVLLGERAAGGVAESVGEEEQLGLEVEPGPHALGQAQAVQEVEPAMEKVPEGHVKDPVGVQMDPAGHSVDCMEKNWR